MKYNDTLNCFKSNNNILNIEKSKNIRIVNSYFKPQVDSYSSYLDKSIYNNINKNVLDNIIDINEYFIYKEISQGENVYLNVYNVTKYNKYICQLLGIGIYHSAIEVYNYEFYYGENNEKNLTGIVKKSLNIKENTIFEFKEKIFLGKTLYKLTNILDIINILGRVWDGMSYCPFNKNCNHFSQEFANVLLINDLNIKSDDSTKYCIAFPLYLNRFTCLGNFLLPFYNVLKNIVFSDIPEDNIKYNCIKKNINQLDVNSLKISNNQLNKDIKNNNYIIDNKNIIKPLDKNIYSNETDINSNYLYKLKFNKHFHTNNNKDRSSYLNLKENNIYNNETTNKKLYNDNYLIKNNLNNKVNIVSSIDSKLKDN